jgi:hypothetical protein
LQLWWSEFLQPKTLNNPYLPFQNFSFIEHQPSPLARADTFINIGVRLYR